MNEDAYIAAARRVVREETGTDDDRLTIVVLARMLVVANAGFCPGYARTKPTYPGRPLKLDDKDPIA